MLVLRQCGVPKMNYTLRCMPPPCIEQLATSFDTHVMHAAQRKLLLHPDEAKRRPTVERLRAPLRHGGFGLASARQTSPAAYLGSLAAVACAPTFAPYSNPDSPLPSSTQLYDWIASSIAALVDAAPECEALLPPSPSVFFQHETILTTTSLQHELSQQATNSSHKASLQRATDTKKTDDGRALAHLTAVSAPRALPGRTVLSDVVVCHPPAPGTRNTKGARRLATAQSKETTKNRKYAHLSSRHRFVQLPIALETTGGVGPRTATLIEAMADASAEQLVTWSRESVIRELLVRIASVRGL